MEVKKCFVPSCGNTSVNAPAKLFITIPRKPDKRSLWFNAVGRGVGVALLKKIGMFCCEDHFELSADAANWMFFKTIGSKIIMKDDAIPHKHLASNPVPKEMSQCTESTRKRKTELLTKVNQQQLKKAKRQLFEESNVDSLSPTKGDSAQASVSGTFGVTVCQSISPDNAEAQLPYLTPSLVWGSPSSCVSGQNPSEGEYSPTKSELLSVEGTTVNQKTYRCESTISLLETKSRFYMGLPEEMYVVVKCVSRQAEVYYRDVLITFKKIRLNDTYSRLGDDFNLNSSTICRIFTAAVPKITDVMVNFIFWPTSDTIKALLPIPFRARYSNVQSIIDCLEIEVQKPDKDPEFQLLTWSQYKHCNTFKLLISATPNGFINYISGAYGGRISDKEIVEKCGYLDVLPQGAQVMADRGFKHVVATLAVRKCTLVRPPSVAEGEKLSKEMARESRDIAALRIHIERVIRRIREFEMLSPHACIHHSLLYLMNHIAIIADALVNTQPPIIK